MFTGKERRPAKGSDADTETARPETEIGDGPGVPGAQGPGARSGPGRSRRISTGKAETEISFRRNRLRRRDARKETSAEGGTGFETGSDQFVLENVGQSRSQRNLC